MAGEIICQIPGQRFRALGIVSAVQKKERFSPENFKAGRPADIAEPRGNGFLGNGPAALAQRMERLQNDSRVAQLMGAEKGEPVFLSLPGKVLTVQIMVETLQIAFTGDSIGNTLLPADPL